MTIAARRSSQPGTPVVGTVAGVDDVEAIKQLKARYFRAMDTKDWDAMRDVFTDDVVVDTTFAQP